MPSYSGTITSSQGVRTLDITTRDVITFTPTSAIYTVEYPIGTVAISSATTTQSITSNGTATQLRIVCASGSVAYANADNADSATLSTAAAAAAQTVFDATGNVGVGVAVTGADNLVGTVLTAALTTGFGATGYQWTRNGVDLGGATASTYTLVNADAGTTVAVRATGLFRTSSTTAIDSRTVRTSFVLSAGRSVVGQTATGYLTGFTRYNTRRRVDILGGALVNPKVLLPSFVIKTTGYAAAPNAFTVGCAIEYNGVSYPVLFSAASTVSLSSAANWVTSDAVTLTIPSGATAYLRTEVTTAGTGDFIPAGEFAYPGSYTVEQVILGGTTGQLAAVGAMTAGASGGGALAGFANEYPYSGLALVGSQPSVLSKSILAVGMSITDGVIASYDTAPDAAGNVGWFAKGAYAAGIPFTKLTRGSNQARWCVTSFAGDAYTNLMASSSHVVLDIFTNDIANAARTLGQVQADCLSLAASARSASAKVYVVKIIPRTNSSNAPVTGFAPGGTREQFNAWLDTQVGSTIDGVINFNDLMESGSTGTWSNYAAQTSDGVHPLPALFTTMAARFQTIAAAW